MGRPHKNGATPEAAFFASIIKTETCWLWADQLTHSGYGKFCYQGRYWLAHRLIYLWTFGEIPEGMQVCHNCPGKDNPTCVNPDHLWIGTQKQNTQDASVKGRMIKPKGEEWHKYYGHFAWHYVNGDDHWTRKNPEKVPRGDKHYKKINPELGVRGERVNTAKLTEELVRQIRQEYVPWKVSTPFLAKKYGISKAQAHKIVVGDCWKHIPLD